MNNVIMSDVTKSIWHWYIIYIFSYIDKCIDVAYKLYLPN